MRPGLTLIEVLAVVTLLAIAAAMATAGLSAAHEAAQLREAASIFRNADAQARFLASTGDQVILRIGEESNTVELWPVGIGRVRAFTLGSHVSARLLDRAGDARIDVVHIDRRGQSTDYRVSLRVGERAGTLRVSGLTGWVEQAP